VLPLITSPIFNALIPFFEKVFSASSLSTCIIIPLFSENKALTISFSFNIERSIFAEILFDEKTFPSKW
jgi:hypothetical protein